MRRSEWESGEAGAAVGDWLLELFGGQSSEGMIRRDPELRASVERARSRWPQSKGELMSIDWGELLGQGMTMYRERKTGPYREEYAYDTPGSFPAADPGRPYRRRKRRSVLDLTATRRAIGRLKRARKFLQRIEREIPRKLGRRPALPFYRRRRR